MEEINLRTEKYDFEEECKNYVETLARHAELQESDISGAYQLSKDALQSYNRWSQIKHDIKKMYSGRGEQAVLKKRLEEMCTTLFEIYNFSKMTWRQGKENLRNCKEDM